MTEQIYSTGKIFELVHLPQPDGRVFEVARRAPGTRVIIADRKGQNLLLTKEFRREVDGYDYRLPGGKVFDTLAEYEQFRQSGADILQPASAKAKAESAEEAGMQVDEVKLFKKSSLGATVEWDLYVFEATKWQGHPDGQALEDGEDVTVGWYKFDEVKDMILRGDMQEERIALILLRWLREQN